jgi:outer membrane lipoprotein-sorting protein
MTKNIAIFIIVLLLAGGGFLLFSEKEEKTDEESLEETSEETTREIMEILKKAEEIDSLKYDAVVRFPEGSYTLKFWEKGDNLRMNIMVQGREMINLWDKKEEIGYLYTAGDTIATKIDITQADGIFESSIVNWAKEALNHDLIVVKEVFLEDKDCYVVKYEKGENEITMWVWKEKGVPVKIENKEEWREMEIVIENIEMEDFSDNIFHLPMGIEVTEEFLFF